MKLSGREMEKLMLHNAGFLAQKRLARGLRLNYTETIALIATQVSHLSLSFYFTHLPFESYLFKYIYDRFWSLYVMVIRLLRN